MVFSNYHCWAVDGQHNVGEDNAITNKKPYDPFNPQCISQIAPPATAQQTYHEQQMETDFQNNMIYSSDIKSLYEQANKKRLNSDIQWGFNQVPAKRVRHENAAENCPAFNFREISNMVGDKTKEKISQSSQRADHDISRCQMSYMI